MSSDVGASRIWNRLLDAAFDNSDRRKHGMGIVGRVLSRRKRFVGSSHHAPESNRKRKLGGNYSDHRPYFTYWISLVQILVLFISMLVYGVGPIGVDLYKKAGMVNITIFLKKWCIKLWWYLLCSGIGNKFGAWACWTHGASEFLDRAVSCKYYYYAFTTCLGLCLGFHLQSLKKVWFVSWEENFSCFSRRP